MELNAEIARVKAPKRLRKKDYKDATNASAEAWALSGPVHARV